MSHDQLTPIFREAPPRGAIVQPDAASFDPTTPPDQMVAFFVDGMPGPDVAAIPAADDAEQSRTPRSFHILANAVSCEPPSAEEMRLVAQKGTEGGVRHLVTVAILHCAGVHGTIRDHHAVVGATENIAKASRRRMPKTDRDPLVKKLQASIAGHQPQAAHYAIILGEVTRQETAFTDRYFIGDRPNVAALGTLYDYTDELRHPAVAALENIRGSATSDAGASEQRRRTTVTRAAQLLRFMISEAI